MRILEVDTRLVRNVQVQYYLLAEDCGIGENYGVRIVYGESESQVLGITASGVRIVQLLRSLVECSVTPVALRDVVEDWLLQD